MDHSSFPWGQEEERYSQQGQLLQMEGGIFSHRKKCLSDRHRVSKNSLAERLMALGIIANVRGRGVSEFAQVAERERVATD